MIGMDRLTEIVKVVILTGKVGNPGFNPVSLLLISPPEHGKTSLVLSQKTPCVMPLTDLTGKGIRDVTLRAQQVTHIAILDLLMVTAHKSKVSQYLLAHMNAIAEEGYIGSATPEGVTVLEKPIKKAFICCLTPDMSKDGRRNWNKIGFATRMLPIFYLFSDMHKQKVRDAINYNPPAREIVLKDFALPSVPIPVKLDKKYIRQIDSLAKIKSDEMSDNTGFRRLKQFRALALGHALLRTWKKPEVNAKDIDFLEGNMKYISYTKGHEL